MRVGWIARRVTVLLCLLLSSCSSRLPQAGSPVLSLPPATQAQGNQLLPLNTQITFIGSALLASHEGTFTAFAGQLHCPDLNPAHARLSVQIQMDSVYTEIPLLTKHLKQPDFFDAAKFPLAAFTSYSIDQAAASTDMYQITGQLTLHGVARTIRFPAHIRMSGNRVTIDAALTVRQSDFAMQSARITNDEVPVKVSARIGWHTPTTGQSDPAS